MELATDQLLNYWLRNDSQSAMSIPLELRSPLLDYRVVELGFRLPLEYLMRDGWMKWILREAMAPDLPESVTWRRNKSGFPFPLSEWLIRHEARIQRMLIPLDCPYIDVETLRSEWVRMTHDDPVRLWAIVSVALWWRKTIEGEALVG